MRSGSSTITTIIGTSVALALALCGAPLAAQHDAMHGGMHGGATSATAKARAQIGDVQRATAVLGMPDSARSAGFSPMFGWIPTMGTHWVNPRRMLAGKGTTLTEPSQLMFSTIGGKPTLVGAAYAYFAPSGDTSRPLAFDGNPPWHGHPDLAPPGTDLVMLHVWFVPSPDGPFAGHNPFLPFWAAGLTPPDSLRFRDDAAGRRVRRAALAIAAVVDTVGLFPGLVRQDAVRPVLAKHRAAVKALMPALEAARTAKDDTRWDRVADAMGTHWDAMRAAYLAAVTHAPARARMAALFDDMQGAGHGAGHGEGAHH